MDSPPAALASATPWILLCAVSCGLLLWSDRRSWRPGVWIFKPLASTAFVVTALACGALDSSYGIWMLGGLVLCWLGDVLLIPKDKEAAFLAGIGSFLLGHVAYTIAFMKLGLAWAAFGVAALVVAGLGVVVLRWLRPHLKGIFEIAVPAYVLVIGVMVATSVAGFAAGATAAIPIGALMFAVSDVSVARDRMVAPGFVNAAWGLPLYFGGQLVLAVSVASFFPTANG